MKNYFVIFAEDVPHYGMTEIEAADDAAVIEAAKAFDVQDIASDPDWGNSVCKRIVHIENEQGATIAEDIPLDDYHLRNGGEADRILCDAAQELLQAIRKIAATPLWGEALPPGDLRDEFIATAQYDTDTDEFNPSAETECDYLRDAVELARMALLAIEGRGS